MPEVKYAFYGASTNLATFTTEDNLMKTYPACLIPGDYFTRLGKLSSSAKLRACGQVGSTGTPTFTFSVRLIAGDDSTAWSAGGILLGSSNAVTAGSTVTLAPYQIDLDIGVRTVGAAGGSTTALVTIGTITGLGFPTAGSIPASNISPLVSTLNAGTTYSLFISCACGTSNSLNLVNLQMLKVYLEN
jgi:hypothetical protein